MDDRRKPRRQRTLKKGRIVFNRHRSTIDCMVRDLSDEGACLHVASPLGIPDGFDLVVDSDPVSRPARVIWRDDDRIGVSFG